MLELIGQKIGMSHVFQEDGVMSPITFIKIYDNCVLDFAVNEDKDFNTLTIAFKKVEAKKLNKSQIGFFNKKSVAMFKKVKQSKVKKG